MSEWLRRQIRNLLGIARVGSSPAGVDNNFLMRRWLLHFCCSTSPLLDTIERISWVRCFPIFNQKVQVHCLSGIQFRYHGGYQRLTRLIVLWRRMDIHLVSYLRLY